MGLFEPYGRYRRCHRQVALKLRQIWADNERALNELLDGCLDFLSEDQHCQIKEYIEVNEYECAYHLLRDVLEDNGQQFPGNLQHIQIRLEQRFYG
jgi:hypothetical protein